jgi:hypothetical protein
MASRRYDVRVGGRRFFFSYSHDQRQYRFTFGDVPHEGDAASLVEARQQVRLIVRAGLDQGEQHPEEHDPS